MSVDLPKLAECVKDDYMALGNFRQGMITAVREFVGGFYGNEETPVQVSKNPVNPVNMISLYVRVLGGHLVGSDPRMMASTFNRALKPFIQPFQEWSNRRLKKMKFADIYRRAIEDAFLAPVGIVKTYPTSPHQARFLGYGAEPAQVWCSNVAFQDFVCDTRATKFSECSYMGHRYRVLYEDVKRSKLYKAKAKKDMVPKKDNLFNADGTEKLQSVGLDGRTGEHAYYDYVELWEIWDRYENKLITYDADGDFSIPLMEQDWVGHSCGPFQFMFFQEVPNNLMPKSPFMDWYGLHTEYNTLWSKLSNQASEAKQVNTYRDEAQAGAFMRARDGDYVQTSTPDSVQPKIVGPGPMPNVANWSSNVYETANRFAGNVDSIGGLGAQADTATQEKLVHTSASNLIQSMGHRATFFLKDVFDAMGYLWWKSPHESFTSRHTPMGASEYGIDREITPMQRFGKPFDEIDLSMDPYSVVARTPQNQDALIDATVKNLILPILPMLNQPGMVEMIGEVIKYKAEVNNCPKLLEIWEKLVGMEGPPAEQAQAQEPAMPNEPTEHTRISKPGMTDRGNRQVLDQMMASGKTGMNGQDLGQFSGGY